MVGSRVMRWLSLFGALAALGACSGDSGGSAGSEGSEGSTTTAGTASEAGSVTETTTGSMTGTTSGAPVCASNPPGEWNACKDGPLTMNSRCNWSATPEHPGSVTCLVPTGGGSSVCTIEGCEDACDCFQAPSSGSAVVACVPVFAGGVKGCILECGDGATCPDGMECRANTSTCYWPNT
jgi:hypothetical protein